MSTSEFDSNSLREVSKQFPVWPIASSSKKIVPRRSFYVLFKRSIDLLASAFLILLLSPVFLFISVLVKLQDGGPAFFRQERHGLNGSKFKIIKFRTMTTAASSNGFVQCKSGDLRVTELGRVLRQTSLDELPQLFNVFLGTMSLVGPRPHAIEHDFQYGSVLEKYWLRYSVLPGMTGLAQVRGQRGPTLDVSQMSSRVSSDIEYVKRASLRLDISILFSTVAVVLNGQNAI